MKIVFLDSMTIGTDIDLSRFNDLGEFVCYEKSSREEAYSRVADAEVLIVNKVIADAELMSHAPKLKMVAVTATGYNNVDLSYASAHGIVVANAAGYSTDSVVQHTFALVFALAEKMDYYSNYVRSGEYTKSPMFCNLGRTFYEIKGKRWGIIGLGNIGREVARIATAFGCEVVYYSTSGKNNNSDYKRVSLDEMLETCDIITVHAPLNDNTQKLMNYEAFCKMKNTAIFVNVGRGPIVDEAGLVAAIRENQIAGAGLDVLDVEPMREDCILRELAGDERLIVTPHVAWATFEARGRLMSEVYLNIEAFLKGEKRNVVNS